MPALDFNEIAPAHSGRERDQFELFARDFLTMVGFEVVQEPDTGADAGRDLIVSERRQGPGGVTTFNWLVSCKHKATSGVAVSYTDEINIRDRLETHRCQGFIAFYSTVPSNTLAKHLEALQPTYALLRYDRERIESLLLDEPRGRIIAARYFPASFKRWISTSQYAGQTTLAPLPVYDRHFLRSPHEDLATGRAEATERGVPLFVIIYDEQHSSRSRFEYCVGYFMEWESTKRIVDEYFVVAVGPSTDPAFGSLVPADDPLEECHWVVLDGDKVLRSESLYANPAEGRKRTLAVLDMLKMAFSADAVTID